MYLYPALNAMHLSRVLLRTRVSNFMPVLMRTPRARLLLRSWMMNRMELQLRPPARKVSKSTTPQRRAQYGLGRALILAKTPEFRLLAPAVVILYLVPNLSPQQLRPQRTKLQLMARTTRAAQTIQTTKLNKSVLTTLLNRRSALETDLCRLWLVENCRPTKSCFFPFCFEGLFSHSARSVSFIAWPWPVRTFIDYYIYYIVRLGTLYGAFVIWGFQSAWSIVSNYCL